MEVVIDPMVSTYCLLAQITFVCFTWPVHFLFSHAKVKPKTGVPNKAFHHPRESNAPHLLIAPVHLLATLKVLFRE
jgi:hypothetical protein